jgi:regulatory protein
VARASKSKHKGHTGLRGRALALIARRDYTRAELERKLAPLAPDRDELIALLDELAAREWLSDARVLEQYLRVRGRRFGPAYLKRVLLERGVSDALVAPALAPLRESELETARAVWTSKFGCAPRSTSEQARQVRFLQSRGFGTDIALCVVRGAHARDHE